MKSLPVLGLGIALALCGCAGEAPAPAAPSSSPAPSGVAPPPAPVASVAATAAAASGHARVDVPAAIRAVVDAPDRDPADRSLDAGRKPAELLAFGGITSGMKVAELGAGGGYTAELLARVVGPTGVVYGQNTPWLLERYAAKPWAARLAKPVDKNVVKVTREFDDPLPPEAKELDAVFLVLFYHDTFWMKVDRAKMNAAIFRALKPGGVYVIVDHSGRPGTESREVQTLHRIEESVVRAEVGRAGFTLAAEADFLRNADDTRDWSASPSTSGDKRGTSDRFVLKFTKP
jgi:predicted methyltransferase